MPKKLTEVPEELAYLLRDQVKDPVVIGNDVYEMVPLSAAQAEVISKEVAELISTIAEDIIRSVKRTQTGQGVSPQESVDALHGVKSGLEKIVSGGKIIKIVAMALDLDEEIVRSSATIMQLHHLAGILWKQNFDFSSAPEVSVKNFSRLLEALGFGSMDKRVFQWAENAIIVLSDFQHGSPDERIDCVLQAAFDLDLLNQPADKLRAKAIQRNASTVTSPSTSDSPANTSTVNDSLNANLMDVGVDAD